jgi:hypothetical protein
MLGMRQQKVVLEMCSEAGEAKYGSFCARCWKLYRDGRFLGGRTFEYVGTNSCCQGNLEHRLKSCNDQAGILENVSFILPVGISLSQLNSSGSSSAF